MFLVFFTLHHINIIRTYSPPIINKINGKLKSLIISGKKTR